MAKMSEGALAYTKALREGATHDEALIVGRGDDLLAHYRELVAEVPEMALRIRDAADGLLARHGLRRRDMARYIETVRKPYKQKLEEKLAGVGHCSGWDALAGAAAVLRAS